MSGPGAGAADAPRLVTVNGRPRPLPAEPSLAALVAEAGLAGRPVAVEVDGLIVPRAAFAERRLVGGERIEIVTFVGGG